VTVDDPLYRRHSVPVRGGEICVGVWGDDGPLVVLVHGITSSHMAWALVGPVVTKTPFAPIRRARSMSRR